MDALAQMQGQLEELRQAKRKFIVTETEAWQTLPWLALLADGRGDESKVYNRPREQAYGEAYNDFWWHLGRQGMAGVNLQQPRLADKYGGEVSDSDLDFVPLEALDVSALLTELEEKIREPLPEEKVEQIEDFYFKKLQLMLQEPGVLTSRASRVIRTIFPYFPSRESTQLSGVTPCLF